MEPNRNDSQNRGNNPGDNKRPKNLLLPLIITVAIVLIFSLVYNAISNSQYTQTTYDQFKEAMDSGNLEEVQLHYDRILYLTKDEAAKPAGQQRACFTGIPSYADTITLMDELVAMGVKTVDYKIVEDNSGIIMVLYYIIMFALIFGVMRTLTKRMSGEGMMGGFGKSKAKVYMEKQTGVTFRDVAGQDEAKESLQEIIDFLHKPQKYTEIGA